jgi:2-oxo-3-hexenedioate decarboxylase
VSSVQTLKHQDVAELCARVAAAQAEGQQIPKLTNDFPDMSAADGYAIQAALRQHYLAGGHRLIGWKAGLTSRAKMVQMGVSEPLVGFLTDRMAAPEGSAISVGGARMIHPRVECEIGFVLNQPLAGPGCTAADVLAATDCVVGALEVIDSRFESFRFDLPSVIADNGSSTRFVTGSRVRGPAGLDLRSLGVVLEKNGEIVALGAGAAVLGDPAEAVAMLVNILAEQDVRLPAGSFVMSGGITEAIPVAAGDAITARFQDLGSVTARFVA